MCQIKIMNFCRTFEIAVTFKSEFSLCGLNCRIIIIGASCMHESPIQGS